MTGQEQQMLNDLVQKVNRTSLQDKDNDAERLLNDGLGRNPDAIYILAQTVLVQNIALDRAKQQLMAMQQQPQQQEKHTSFLGSLLGHRDPQPQAQPQYQPVQPQYSQPQQQYAQQQAYAPASSGQPSFLRSAATTAAGVAGGMLAFQGVEDLLHGGMGGGGGFGGGFGGDAPREEIVNNYYGDQGGNMGDQGNDPGNDQNWVAGPDEQQQGGFDNSQDAGNYGDDYSDGGGDFGGDDTTNFS